MMIIRVPARYASDRTERGLPMGEIVKRGRSVWACRMDRAVLLDMTQDAKALWRTGHASPDIVRSAMRTFSRLRRIAPGERGR